MDSANEAPVSNDTSTQLPVDSQPPAPAPAPAPVPEPVTAPISVSF